MFTQLLEYTVIRSILGLLGVAVLNSVNLEISAAEPNKPAVDYANHLLDGISSYPWRQLGMEEEPRHEGTTAALIALGEIGWNETFKRLEKSPLHKAWIPVLARRSMWDGEDERTTRLMGLIDEKKIAHRNEIFFLVAKREPMRGNQLLLRFLSDPDPKVRGSCVTSLNPLVASSREVDAVIPLLDDPNGSVRFQSLIFLERATGRVVKSQVTPKETKSDWLEWWEKQQPADLSKIVQAQLAKCCELLTDPQEEFRERVGMPLIIHSGQIYYGFHNQDVWWCVHHGDRSVKAWQKWMRLRYNDKKLPKPTIWEETFRIAHPDLPLEALRATITMNVADLQSSKSSVRHLARASIASSLEDACPFRMGESDSEDDWLNEGIIAWWARRGVEKKE